MKFYSKMVAVSLFAYAGMLFAEAPVGVTITTVNAAGTGCPAGSAYVSISPDRQVFTAIFDRFQAVIDPGNPQVSYADRYKRCDLNVKVHVPQGWQFSVFKADYEGWYDMQAGMSMTQTSTYHFQGNARHSKVSVVNAPAPKSGNFLFTDNIGVSSYEWSACGGPRDLFVTSEIRLSSNNPRAHGAAGIDAIEGQFQLKAYFGILWRQCR